MHYRDEDDCPSERGDPCLNCGGGWSDHSNWACKSPDDYNRDKIYHGTPGHRNRSDLPIYHRYLTRDMLPTSPENQDASKIKVEEGQVWVGNGGHAAVKAVRGLIGEPEPEDPNDLVFFRINVCKR